MSQATVSGQLSPAAVRQQNFEQAVACALHLWPALTLSVQNLWGGPESADKRDWFAGVVVDLFPEFTDAPLPPTSNTSKPAPEEPDMEQVEERLLQVMVDEFEVNVDDETGMEVAGQVIRAREQCAVGNFTGEVKTLQERFANRKSKKVDSMYKRMEDADQDTDWESDDSADEEGDDDADVNMDEAPDLVRVPKEKPVPEVDEDGFTKVTRKR